MTLYDDLQNCKKEADVERVVQEFFNLTTNNAIFQDDNN